MEAMRSVRVRRELSRKIGACGGLEPKKLNILMYVICIAYTAYYNYIGSVVVNNKYKMQIMF